MHNISNYITTVEASAKLGKSLRYVQLLCKEGRIVGAVQFGRDWLMPLNFKVKKASRPRGRPRKKIVDKPFGAQ